MMERESSERRSATGREGLNKDERSHQTKIKPLDVLRMMCCGSSQREVEPKDVNIQNSIKKLSNDINCELREIRKVIETGNFSASLKRRIRNEKVVFKGKGEEKLKYILIDLKEKREALYKIEGIGAKNIKDLRCKIYDIRKQHMLIAEKFSKSLKNDDEIKKLLFSCLIMKKLYDEFSLSCGQKDFLGAGKWANKIILEHKKFEQDYTDAYFQAQFTSAIERQDLCESEQERLAEINRRTPRWRVPEKWQKAFAIAKGKAMVEKVSNLPDKDVDISESFKRYKNEVNYENGKFCVETYKGVREGKDLVKIDKWRYSEIPYRNHIDLNKHAIIASWNWRSYDPSKEPLQNSEVLYNQLLLVLKEQKIDPLSFHLKSVIREQVVNHETKDALMLCDSEDKFRSTEKVTYRFEKGSNEYYAILGTPNVYGTLYLLKQHQSILGKREITSIEVECLPPTKDKPRIFNIALHINECNR